MNRDDAQSMGEQPTLQPQETAGGFTLQPESLIGEYRIIRPLGRGGMGEVYEAENTLIGQRVALKLLAGPAVSREAVERFKRESRWMMDLNHPNIVKVLHAGEAHGMHYLVMDLVLDDEGRPSSLENWTATRPADDAIRRVAMHVCDALEYAHERGVVHRDLKPANILLDTSEASAPYPLPKIADFGLAKIVGEDHLRQAIERSFSASIRGDLSLGRESTAHPDSMLSNPAENALLGTLDYMAPEQKSGGTVTAQTDLYALGVMLYLWLTGQRPEGRFKLPSAFGAARAWDGVVSRCLEPEPEDRYGSAAELRRALSRIRGTSPRRRWIALAAAGVIIGLALGYLFRSSSPAPDAPPVAVQEAPSHEPPPPSATRESREERRAARRERDAQRASEMPPAPPTEPDDKVAADRAGPVEGELWQPSALALELCWIPPGRFTMGSTPEDREWAVGPEGRAHPDLVLRERTPTEIVMPYGYWMQRTPVTRAMFQSFLDASGVQPMSAFYRGVWGIDIHLEGSIWTWLPRHTWEEPGFEQDEDHPAVCISWVDAMAFCRWLTETERAAGLLPEGYEYRLPGELEWEYAARGGQPNTRFWWGDEWTDVQGRSNVMSADPFPTGRRWTQGAAWTDGYAFTAPVDRFGERGRNGFGLADLFGNVLQWCYDVYHEDGPSVHIAQTGGARRTVRGAAFNFVPGAFRAPVRHHSHPQTFEAAHGFRIVLAPVVQPEETTDPVAADDPIVPIETVPEEGRAFLLPNALRMMWIPPGEATLGSSAEERARAAEFPGTNTLRFDPLPGERSPTLVRFEDGFWMGQTTITRAMFAQFADATRTITSMERAERGRFFSLGGHGQSKRGWIWDQSFEISWRSPGFYQADDHPVVAITWREAAAFCDWLTRMEHQAGRLPEGYAYRLPTEEEWEYAARGGRQEPSMYWWGDDIEDARGRANLSSADPHPSFTSWTHRVPWEDGFAFTSPVDYYGDRGRNAFGLADMAGNVRQWCAPEQRQASAATDETRYLPIRGNSFSDLRVFLRLAARMVDADRGSTTTGFRVVLARSDAH